MQLSRLNYFSIFETKAEEQRKNKINKLQFDATAILGAFNIFLM